MDIYRGYLKRKKAAELGHDRKMRATRGIKCVHCSSPTGYATGNVCLGCKRGYASWGRKKSYVDEYELSRR